MAGSGLDWLTPHRGRVPHLRWQFRPDNPVATAVHLREAGDTIVLDELGHLYRVDRRGQLVSINRLRDPLVQIAWADTGTLGVAVAGDRHLVVLDGSLKVLWQTDAPEDILGVAVDPFGNYLAASLADRGTIVFSRHKKKVSSFETIRPLVHLQFLASDPILIVAADHGLLAGFSLGGEKLWEEKVLSGIGSLAVASDGSKIVLAGFTHGVPIHDEVGDALGSRMVEGTATRAAADITCDRLLVATLEQSLFWVDVDGEVLWAGRTPEPVAALAVDPFGEFIQPALPDQGVLRLHWEG